MTCYRDQHSDCTHGAFKVQPSNQREGQAFVFTNYGDLFTYYANRFTGS